MKNIDYRNLKRYDIGKQVINNGYQVGANNTPQTVDIVKPVESANTMNSAQTAQNITSITANAAGLAGNIAQLAKMGAFNPAKFKGASGGDAASSAAGIASGVTGIVSSQLDAANRVSNSDISNMSGKAVQYVDGVPYEINTGFDAQGLRNYTAKQNTGNFINTVLSHTGTGLSIGNLFPGYGTIIGGAAGLLGGIGTGLYNVLHGNAVVEDRISKAITAQDASNRMNESLARTQAYQNKFNAAHADKGRTPCFTDGKSPNCLIQGGETVVEYDKYTRKMGDVFTPPITKEHPERVDNIPVRLDTDGKTHAVLGNEFNPETGNRFAVDSRPYSAMANSSDSVMRQIGRAGIQHLVELQDEVKNQGMMQADLGKEPDLDKLTWVPKKKIEEYKMTRQNKQDMLKYAKSLPKFDAGLTASSVVPGAIGALAGFGQMLSYIKSNPTTYNPYVEDALERQAVRDMPTQYDITNQLAANTQQQREALYRNRTLRGGQRLLANSVLANNAMRNSAALYDNKEKMQTQLMSDKAKLEGQVGAQLGARKMNANAQQYEWKRQAEAMRRKGIETGLAGAVANLGTIGANLRNDYQFGMNLDLYKQQMSDENKKFLAELKAKNANNQNTALYNPAVGQLLTSFNPLTILRTGLRR